MRRMPRPATTTRIPISLFYQTSSWSEVKPTSYTGYGIGYRRASASGSSVTIYFNGTQFDWFATKDNASGTADVYLDNVKAATVNLNNATTLYQQNVWSTTVAGGVHKVEIRWAATTGKYINIDAVDVVGSLVSAPPTITSLSPTSGTTAGGNSVVINGTGFTDLSGAAAVTFGGVNALSYTVNSPTKITAVAPPHAVGTVQVRVTTGGGSTADTVTDNYTYTVVPTRYDQTNTNIVKTGSWSNYASTASSGGSYGRSSTAGASATIYFTGAKIAWLGMKGSTPGIVDVYLDDVKQATLDLYASPAKYQVTLWTSPTLSEGPHHMDLVRSSASLSTEYIVVDAVDIWGTINAAPPTITSLSPPVGATGGGSSVTINGTGFTGLSGPAAVTFGGVNAQSYSVVSATKITAVAPAHAAGTVQVKVTTPVRGHLRHHRR